MWRKYKQKSDKISKCRATCGENTNKNRTKFRNVPLNVEKVQTKIGQNFEMSRYMWRKYKQKSDKISKCFATCGESKKKSEKISKCPATCGESTKKSDKISKCPATCGESTNKNWTKFRNVPLHVKKVQTIIGQNFEMSRYMWRKYKQNCKKRARLDSSLAP
jgi:hypothetical protein